MHLPCARMLMLRPCYSLTAKWNGNDLFLFFITMEMYRDEIYSLQIQLSRTQAGPGRAVKEQQEQISRNHVQTIFGTSVHISIVIKKRKRSLPFHLAVRL